VAGGGGSAVHASGAAPRQVEIRTDREGGERDCPATPAPALLVWPCLYTLKNSKLYKISYHIESCGTCIEY